MTHEGVHYHFEFDPMAKIEVIGNIHKNIKLKSIYSKELSDDVVTNKIY